MGQCTARIQSDAMRVPSHSPSSSKEASQRRLSRFAEDFKSGYKPNRQYSGESLGCSPVGTMVEDHLSGDANVDGCTIQSDHRRDQLLDVRFNRTLFCEDITYEYHIKCKVMEVPEWTIRLTVDQITDFFTETAAQWKTPLDAHIPDQHGKVMQPHVFTSLLENLLSKSGVLYHEDPVLNQRAANFLSIPYELRPVVLYNGEQYSSLSEHLVFEHFTVSLQDRFKYLCHRTMCYPHDYRYDDCCTLYDGPEVEGISFWIRSLNNKVDFQFNLLSNDVFTVLMSDTAFIITEAILQSTNIDEGSAWIITDFLPKELWSWDGSEDCDVHYDSEIVYKYDPREFTPESQRTPVSTPGPGINTVSTPGPYEGDFLLKDANNAMLKRHDMSLEEVHSLCTTLRKQCTTKLMTKIGSFTRSSSGSISEFIESSSSSDAIVDVYDRCDDNHQCAGGIPTTPPPNYPQCTPPNGAYSPMMMKMKTANNGLAAELEQSPVSESSVPISESTDTDEAYRLFFAAFIDEEEVDDINLCQWLSSLLKLKLEVTETELVAAFKFMLQQNVDSEGYIDFVDFTQFCRSDIEERFVGAQRAQHVLRTFIIRK